MEAELILFARTPVPGDVKTRLIPELGERGAADFAAALIEESVRRVVETWPGPVRLQLWPTVEHEVVRGLGRRYGVPVSDQSKGDLGAKMYEALAGAHGRGAAAAVMGCDVPQCPRETYLSAHAFLAQGRSVIGPSSDGGYYLIGINPPRRECFRAIRWGGAKVFDTTLKRAADAGVKLIVLQQLNDLDSASDLEELRKSEPALLKRLIARVEHRDREPSVSTSPECSSEQHQQSHELEPPQQHDET